MDADGKTMYRMHRTFLANLDEAYQNREYIKASWLCYAIMEQRISRMILYHIDLCGNPDRTEGDRDSESISLRTNCIRHLIRENYGAYNAAVWAPNAKYYPKLEGLLDKVDKWCVTRNKLVHTLVSPEHLWSKDAPGANAYDAEFESLATEGMSLVHELYESARSMKRKWKEVRAQWDKVGAVPPFPKYRRCRKNKQQKKCVKT